MSDRPIHEVLAEISAKVPPEEWAKLDKTHYADPDTLATLNRLERENADLRAELEAARKDAERFLWMTADHDDVDVRERVVNLCNRLPTMSASAVRMYIDAAIAQGKQAQQLVKGKP